MGNVNNLKRRIDAQKPALYRADQIILVANIRYKGDERHVKKGM